MNRRQKIIVSVTGIFIVLLILVGLTYAYFLTRITGNSNPTSISVTTANLELVYGDGTTALLTSATPIEPGKFSASKDFTVTNNGNALTDYAVTLEDFAIFYANDTVINGQPVSAGTVTKLEYPNDMKMTITCTIESDDATRNGKSCTNQITNGTLPTENSILVTNSVEVDDIHKYVLSLTYVNSGTDQSKDMNKTIKGKIDIIDPKSTIDLEGTVATYETGDYVEINSTPIKSEIVDGKYKIIGVEPGSHTLNIKFKDENGEVQTRGSETLTIQKGDTASVSGNTIIFTDSSRVATVDVNSDYTVTIDEIIQDSSSSTVETLGMKLLSTPTEGLQPVSEEEDADLGLTHRFVGSASDTVNNYICFGTSDMEICKENPDIYMYRILGVTSDGKVKVVKTNPVSGLGYETQSEIGNWESSYAYKSLNGGLFYENSTFVPEGWQEKIAIMNWYTRPDKGDEFPSKIGMLYVEDVLLSFNYTGEIPSYIYYGVSGTWMEMDCEPLLMSTTSDGSYYLYFVFGDNISPENMAGIEGAWNTYNTFPVFYLENSVEYVDGEGTASLPFIIK